MMEDELDLDWVESFSGWKEEWQVNGHRQGIHFCI
jgi:hypothetical protein